MEKFIVLNLADPLTVGVRSGHPLPEGLMLAVLCRGRLYYCKAWNAALASVIFERRFFPGGVLQFLLSDKSGHALSERLLFNRGDESASTTVACASIPDPRRRLSLDALMMTQGWRRYDVPAALRGEAAELSYPLEAGQELTGTIRENGL